MMRRLAFLLACLFAAGTAASTAAQAPPAETLRTITEGTNAALALSPDGETLALDLLGSIWTLPAEGGEARRLTNALYDARQPDWSPDGGRIAFQAYRDGNWHIWSVRADGVDLRQHTSGVFDDREPAFSHDGTRIVFSSDRSGSYDVWELDVAGGEVTQLTSDAGSEYGPVFAPDDSTIAYAATGEAGNRIVVREADGDEDVVATVGGQVAGVSFSPDGTHVMFNEIGDATEIGTDDERDDRDAGTAGAGRVSRMLLAELPDDEPRVVTAPDEDVFPFRAAWLSDEEFLYTADGAIKRRRLASDDDDPPPAAETVAFEAGVRIFRQEYERRRRDFDGTGERPARGILAPVVAPAGDAVAFVALGDLWWLPVAAGTGAGDAVAGGATTGGATTAGEPPTEASASAAPATPTRLTDDAFVEQDPTFSPDGGTLAFVSNRAGSFDIWLHDVASGEQRPLTDLPGAELMPAFSPDGSRVAFLDEDGRVLAVEVASGEVATLHAALHMPGRPTWSPDGNTVALAALTRYSDRFREGRNELLLISIAGEDDRRVTPFEHRSIGTRAYDGPVWSPDGTKMAFTAGSVLWVVDVGPAGEPTGEPRRLTEEIADSPSWTADGASIVYLNNGRLKRVHVAGGRIEEIPLELTWQRANPTGRRLVHAGALFDGRSDTLRRDVDIVIEGHRISAVEDHSDALHAEIRGDGEAVAGGGPQDPIIDASGLTVMPGLIEMHTHPSPAMNELWLAYGVTTIREPVANAYGALEAREAIAAGVRPGPREFFTGESFDGSRIYYSGSMALDAREEVRLQLERADALGYDLIKTYVRLPDTLQFAVINGAHELGIPVTSHELYPAAAIGADGVEHIRGTSRRGYSPKVSQLNRSYQDVIELLTFSKMTLTPTVGIYGGFRLAVARDPSLLADERFRTLLPAAVVEEIEQAAAALREDPAAQQALAEGLIAPYGDTLRRVLGGGGRIIAGTDSPLIAPGISLHTELANFVDGGLTPFEALQSATVWAAEALGAPDDLGTVEPGRLADLLVVEGDPLTDITATRNMRMVIKNGELFRLEDLLR